MIFFFFFSLLPYSIRMNQEAKSCYLKTNDKSLLTVYLPHNKPIFVGRSPETNITDTQCSRLQG